MKNFTFLLIMFLISFGLSAKSSSELQKKIQQKQEKISVITLLNARLNSLDKLNGSGMNLKSAATTEKLDSTVNRILNEQTQQWQNDYKDEYLYDTEMKNTAWIEREWNLANNSWEIISKTELGFDNNDRTNSMLSYEKDELTHVLKKVSSILVFYNSEGLQDSLIMNSTENDGLNWVVDMKQINHYNDAKQVIKTDYWVFDEDLGELTLMMNTVNTYTTSGKISSSSMSIFDEGVEMLWSISEYNYDGSDKLTSIEYSALSFLTFAMEKSSRILYQYNASGNRTATINSSWNGTSWDDDDKTEYQFSPAGDVSVEIFSTWNGTAWMQEWKDEYTFSSTNFSDVAFPQIGFITDIFSSFLNLFGIKESIDLSYNKLVTGVNHFEMLNGNWKNTEKTTFYYSGEPSTNINEIENSVISVYPNPTNDWINFSWKGNNEALSLQIYQITGAKILEQTVYSGRPVSISHFQNGVYLFKLLNGQQNVKTGKMIKR